MIDVKQKTIPLPNTCSQCKNTYSAASETMWKWKEQKGLFYAECTWSFITGTMNVLKIQEGDCDNGV